MGPSSYGKKCILMVHEPMNPISPVATRGFVPPRLNVVHTHYFKISSYLVIYMFLSGQMDPSFSDGGNWPFFLREFVKRQNIVREFVKIENFVCEIV